MLWSGDFTTYFWPCPWYCTQIASNGNLLLPPGSAFRRILRFEYHHFGVVCATVSSISTPFFGIIIFSFFVEYASFFLSPRFFAVLPAAPPPDPARMKEEPVEAVVVRTARKDSEEVVEAQRKVEQ